MINSGRGRDVPGRYEPLYGRHGNLLLPRLIADADFLPHNTFLHPAEEKLKHVKLLPGSIKTQEGQTVKELSVRLSLESEAPLRGGLQMDRQ